MNTITEQDILDIINELDDAPAFDEAAFKSMVNGSGIKVEQKFDTSNLPRWEDRTAMDRFTDFVQTTEPSDLAKLAGLALMAVCLLSLSLFM